MKFPFRYKSKNIEQQGEADNTNRAEEQPKPRKRFFLKAPPTEAQLAAGLENRRELYDWLQCLLTALVICVLVFIFLVRIIDVKGNSMVPTLTNGEKMVVSRLFYTPTAGDVVVFHAAEYDDEKALVKRIIATEGQEINIDFENGIVYVDGEAIEEAYINELTYTKLDFIGPKTVPAGCVFCMGDNRNASTDSRDSRIGMVDTRLILGKVYFVIYPLTSIGTVN